MPKHINVAIDGHPLVGTEHVYRPDQPPYDPDSDREGGRLVVAPGFTCMVRAVFTDWNGVPGLDMLYLFVHATGEHTHASPKEITGWDAENLATMLLSTQPKHECDGLPLDRTTCPDKAAHM